MNEVDISTEGVAPPPWIEEARNYCLAALDRLGKSGWELSILLCDDSFIRGLNRQYRHRDEPTDVLSFEQGETYRDETGAERFLAGDIVICLDALGRNAEDFGVSKDEELRRLIVHGLLHLAGMDHEDEDPGRPMLALQEKVIRDLTAGGRGGRIL
jgi:probable rRNA maturation factor